MYQDTLAQTEGNHWWNGATPLFKNKPANNITEEYKYRLENPQTNGEKRNMAVPTAWARKYLAKGSTLDGKTCLNHEDPNLAPPLFLPPLFYTFSLKKPIY